MDTATTTIPKIVTSQHLFHLNNEFVACFILIPPVKEHTKLHRMLYGES